MPESRIERERQTALAGTLDRVVPFAADGSAAILVTTTTVTTYPVTAASFYASNPTEIDGDDIEGGMASYATDTTQIAYVLNVGTQIPPTGTRVVAHAVGGRWVFRYDG